MLTPLCQALKACRSLVSRHGGVITTGLCFGTPAEGLAQAVDDDDDDEDDGGNGGTGGGAATDNAAAPAAPNSRAPTVRDACASDVWDEDDAGTYVTALWKDLVQFVATHASTSPAHAEVYAVASALDDGDEVGVDTRSWPAQARADARFFELPLPPELADEEGRAEAGGAASAGSGTGQGRTQQRARKKGKPKGKARAQKRGRDGSSGGAGVTTPSNTKRQRQG